MPARKGRQEPTYEQIGAYRSTDGPQACELASVFWGEPIEWQRLFLDVMLARDARDKYRFHNVGISLARQNGKSWDVRARCFYGLVADGEKILYTCQHGDTADEMFKALAAPFEDEDNEELHELLKAVRKTNGQQAIYLDNGGYIRFTTRTNSLARGKSYDVIIYDEAQELTQAQQSASLPTISASAKHNTQVIYLGTPPGPEAAGEVFRGIRERVHSGDSPEMAWLEWSVSEIGDKSDTERWYEANPSLGYLIDEIVVQGECDGMAPDAFARERLGWWVEKSSVPSVISPGEWARCGTAEPAEDGKYVYAVKFSPDGSVVSLCVAVKPDEGIPHVELLARRFTSSGTKWLSAWLIQRKRTPAEVVIDGLSGAQALQERISGDYPKRAIFRPKAGDVTAAASLMLESVRDETVTWYDDGHGAQDELTASATTSPRRSIGSFGGWGFGGDDPTPIEAASLALWRVVNTKRDPRRKQTVW